MTWLPLPPPRPYTHHLVRPSNGAISLPYTPTCCLATAPSASLRPACLGTTQDVRPTTSNAFTPPRAPNAVVPPRNRPMRRRCGLPALALVQDAHSTPVCSRMPPFDAAVPVPPSPAPPPLSPPLHVALHRPQAAT
ncbi:hypothetical protein DENSPDRAFT_877997 [Dentipellis sp. KUC8613]|nr:hypothetical protein DENSPDRAFT_877997 [Dentipellis sp. KUC8613]